MTAAGMLAGCSMPQEKFTPPTTPEGQFCITACQKTSDTCVSTATQKAQAERQECERTSRDKVQQCERKAEQDYQSCQRKADSDYRMCEDRKRSSGSGYCTKQSCYKSTSSCSSQFCSQSPQLSGCNTNYRACYQGCGGTVTVE